ncbi:hypothetical protein VP01_1955g3 [Puccinia sorghi]|uniref:Uncharacterized protein n=1 Tax=Puccinia sorghi TaxID=27349 RepID=A0A0L6VCK4_9BASI|nr:hypothetical protein VP01_1955g3 [Puccinia sorghi]
MLEQRKKYLSVRLDATLTRVIWLNMKCIAVMGGVSVKCLLTRVEKKVKEQGAYLCAQKRDWVGKVKLEIQRKPALSRQSALSKLRQNARALAVAVLSTLWKLYCKEARQSSACHIQPKEVKYLMEDFSELQCQSHAAAAVMRIGYSCGRDPILSSRTNQPPPPSSSQVFQVLPWSRHSWRPDIATQPVVPLKRCESKQLHNHFSVPSKMEKMMLEFLKDEDDLITALQIDTYLNTLLQIHKKENLVQGDIQLCKNYFSESPIYPLFISCFCFCLKIFFLCFNQNLVYIMFLLESIYYCFSTESNPTLGGGIKCDQIHNYLINWFSKIHHFKNHGNECKEDQNPQKWNYHGISLTNSQAEMGHGHRSWWEISPQRASQELHSQSCLPNSQKKKKKKIATGRKSAVILGTGPAQWRKKKERTDEVNCLD